MSVKLGEVQFDPNSQITISGHLEEVDFNSNIGRAKWIFKLKAISNNSESIIINTTYTFPGSFVAEKACSDVAHAFIPAVHKLINEILNHKNFNELLKT